MKLEILKKIKRSTIFRQTYTSFEKMLIEHLIDDEKFSGLKDKFKGKS